MFSNFLAAIRPYWLFVKKTFQQFSNDNIFTYAAALSYYTIFSLPPMLLIVLHSTTLVYDRSTVKSTIFGELSEIIGPKSADQLSETVNSLGLFEGSIWTSLIGFVALVFTSTTVFITIQNALNKVFKVKTKANTGWWKLVRDRLISFALLLSIAFILIVSLVVNAIISSFGTYLSEFIPDLSIMLITISSLVIPFIILALLFTLIFRYLPDIRLAWRDTWIGAIVTTVLFSIGKYGIDFYIGNSQAANLYEAASSVMVIMLWVFYASVIFLYGAVFTYVYANEFGKKKKIKATKYAERISAEGLNDGVQNEAHF